MAVVSPGAPKSVTFFDLATTAANGTGQWINVSGYRDLCFYLTTVGSPGAGTCILEESDSPNPAAGSVLSTVTITSGVGNDAVAAFHYSGAFRYVRARIGTTVTSATLKATLEAI